MIRSNLVTALSILIVTGFSASASADPEVKRDPISIIETQPLVPDKIETPPFQFTDRDGDGINESLMTDAEVKQQAESSRGITVSAQEVEELKRECEEKFKTASDACGNPNSTAGMSPSNAMTLGNKLALLGQLGQIAASATGNSKICTLAAGLSSAAQVISMIKGQACSASQNVCANRCDEYAEKVEARREQLNRENAQPATPAATKTQNTTEINRLQPMMLAGRKSRRTCEGYAVQAGQALIQAQMLANSLTQAAQCAKDTSTQDPTVGPIGVPTPPALVTSDIDCSNPQYASTSMACICKSTPGDPMCAAFNGGPGAGGGAGGGMAGGSIATPGLSGDTPSDGDVVDQTPVGAQGKGGSYGVEGGGGGGGLGGGSGGGLLGGGDGEGAAGSALDKNVITGTSGGGGGVGALTAGGGGGGGGRMGGGGSGGGGGGGFNFKKYLPKSLFKNRGLAGMTVPSTDGITGPMGPSIWEKVTNRYQVKKSSLIQDK